MECCFKGCVEVVLSVVFDGCFEVVSELVLRF